MHKYLILFLSILLMTCSESKDSSLLESIILSLENDFPSIVSDPGKHRLQVLYTQIDRDENNYPKFTTHKFRLRPREYFYPASTTKFPIAVLALEKANQNSKQCKTTSRQCYFCGTWTICGQSVDAVWMFKSPEKC